MYTSIFVIAAVVIGILTGYWLRSNSARTEAVQLDRRGAELATERDALRSELAARTANAEKTAAEISRLQTELTLERGNAEKLTNQFKVLAAEILKENSTAFAKQNSESLSHLLNPLTKDLTDFKAKVEKATEENLVGRTQLASHLEGLKTMHQRLSDEAHNLSTALRRDTKTQGNWGELILLDLLENQGLKQDIHYTFQQSFVATEDDATRRRQTDVIIKLPKGATSSSTPRSRSTPTTTPSTPPPTSSAAPPSSATSSASRATSPSSPAATTSDCPASNHLILL